MEESSDSKLLSFDESVDGSIGEDGENLIFVQLADSNEELVSGASRNDKPKKIKTTNSKRVADISVEEECEEDGTPWARALKTDLILQQIFRYLPTGVLLSPCSLINKFWNAKARSFIWTYRKCTPKSKRYVRSTCKYLQEVREQCRQITAHGRSVPFNNLILMSNEDDRYECDEDPSNSDSESAKNLGGEIKVKYLMAFGRDIVSQCPVHQPFSTVLQSGSIGGELRLLKIHKVLACGAVLDHIGWKVTFPKLQKLDIFHVNIHGFSQIERQAMKDIVEKLLQRAPNLGELYFTCTNTLGIVPKEKYKLVKKLDFRLRRNLDMELLQQIAKLCYGIKDLEITEPPFKREARKRNWGDDEPVSAELRRQFEITVEQMLKTCKENLKTILIVGAVPLALCSSVTLLNVTSFTIKNRNNGKVPQLWDTLASIDYSKMLPNLHKMEIIIGTLIWSPAERIYVAGNESHIEWPQESYSNEANSCFTVRELKLNVDVEKVNLYLVWWLAPNVRELVVRCSHTWATWSDLPSISKICELWPCLTQLKISGDKNCLKRNYDAEFCGISEEEADLIREKDEDFLQAVHIVPIQPCISTMKYLWRLEVDLKFSGRACKSRSCRSLTFISKVTELVVLKRMSDKDFCILGTLDAVEIDDDGNGEEDCNCHDDDEEHSNVNNEDDVDGESDASVDDGEGDTDAYEDEEEGESDDCENQAEEESETSSVDVEEGDSDSDDNEGGDSDDVDVPEDHENDRDSGEDDGNAEQSD